MSKEEFTWSNLAIKLAINTALHPFEYAKVLIQIGHEPMPPYVTKTFFGRPALALPNIFRYVGYIRKTDGYSGLYKGLAPKLCASCIGSFTLQKVSDSFNTETEQKEQLEGLTDEERAIILRRTEFVRTLTRDILAKAAAVTVSQPFNVIAIRIMAQFVGKETRYDGIFQPIKEIFQENGIFGFFSGLIPRLIGEALTLLIASTLAYAINSYIEDDFELRTWTAASTSYIASGITYPFQVVSNCMVVTNSGLAAGSFPNMPLYTSWIDCWNHLRQINHSKRGSSILIRYYTGPVMIDNSQLPQKRLYY